MAKDFGFDTLKWMLTMPEIVTHRYDPRVGACLNMCSLPDVEALRVLDQLRRGLLPTLKPDYLDRRHRTESWLAEAAAGALGRSFQQRPAYFFLGDFSYGGDPSRPAALVVPLSRLPADAITFTLGDSMSVVEQPARRVYTLNEMVALFVNGIAEFGLSDRDGFQARFIELQLWDVRAFFASKPNNSRPQAASPAVDASGVAVALPVTPG